MSPPSPRTPTRAPPLPHDVFSPYHSYFDYAFQPCPSPTPFPSTDRTTLDAISPYQYQLAHLNFTPLLGASAASSSGATLSATNALLWAQQRANAPYDASHALKPSVPSFSTLTAAETLLSVQHGSSPSRSPSSSQLPSQDTSPSRLAPAWPWSPPKFSISSPFTSPTSQSHAGSKSSLRKANPWSDGQDENSNAMAMKSSQESYSSQSSSLDHTVGSLSSPFRSKWTELPKTPSKAERLEGRHMTRDRRRKYLWASPEQRGDTSLSSVLNYDYTLKSPQTPGRESAGGSFGSFEDALNGTGIGFYNLSDPLQSQLYTPDATKRAFVAISDVSPILRHGEQMKEQVEGQVAPVCAQAPSPIDVESDSDKEDGLYASSSSSNDEERMHSSVYEDSEEDESDEELPHAVVKTSEPSCEARLANPSQSPLQMTERTNDRANITAALYSTRIADPSHSSLHSSIKYQPGRLTAALNTTRAAKVRAERAIAALAAHESLSPPKTRVKDKERPGADLTYTDGSEWGSPLSSAPSTPPNNRQSPRPLVSPKSLTLRNKERPVDIDDLFGTRISPLQRPTRAHTKALAAVLRPYHAVDHEPTATTSATRSLIAGQRTTIASKGRKRARSEVNTPGETSIRKMKKRRLSSGRNTGIAPPGGNTPSDPAASASDEGANDRGQDPGRRTFPPSVTIHNSYSAFYRKFALPNDRFSPSSLPGAVKNEPRSEFDLYTPRWVKGRGTTKVGLCPICAEPRSRGGEGKRLWLSMKFSAFNYHMQYYHGISPSSGLPFSPPVAFEFSTDLPQAKQGFKQKQEKTRIEQGKCHKCRQWVPVEGVKDVEVKVKEIFWWKHAAVCHQRSTISGEQGIFIEDEVYKAALAAANNQPEPAESGSELNEQITEDQ